MKTIQSWEHMNVARLCEEMVFDGPVLRWAEHVPAAEKVCSASGL